jgi:hypothetical protein
MRAASTPSTATASQDSVELALFPVDVVTPGDQAPDMQRSVPPPALPRVQPASRPARASVSQATKRAKLAVTDSNNERQETVVNFLALLSSMYAYTPRQVPGDGNCTFAAISKVVFNDGSPQAARQRRDELAVYANQRQDMHALIELENNMTISEWIARTLADGEWGSPMHIVLAEELYDMRILLFITGATSGPQTWDDAAYAAIRHRPTRAVWFDPASNHYSPLARKGEEAAVCLSNSQLLAAARQGYWQARLQERQGSAAEIQQLFDAQLRIESATVAQDQSVTAQSAVGPQQPTQASVASDQLIYPGRAHVHAGCSGEDCAHMDARGQAPLFAAQRPVSLPSNVPGAGTGGLGNYYAHHAPAASSFDPQVSVRPVRAVFQPVAGNNQRSGSTTPAPPASFRPVEKLVWPHKLEHFSAFQSAPKPFPPQLCVRLRAVGRPLQPGDAVVLPSQGDGPALQTLWSWEALATCHLLLYKVRAFAVEGNLLQYEALLWSPLGQATPPVCPLHTCLSTPTSWFVTYDESPQAAAPPVSVTVAPSVFNVRQPEAASYPPQQAFAAMAPTTADSLHLMQFKDSIGLTHTYSKNTALAKAKRLEPLSVLAGPTRLQELTGRHGMFVANYTAPILLQGAAEWWRRAQRELYPQNNAFTAVPIMDLHWYRHSEEGELGFRTLCFEWADVQDGHTPCLRLGHFLPAETASMLPLGALTTGDHWVQALEGVGQTYGVLYHEEYARQFTALVSQLRLGPFRSLLSPAFVESLILRTLAAFHCCAMNIDSGCAFPGSSEIVYPREVQVTMWPAHMCSALWRVLSMANELDDMRFSKLAPKPQTFPPPSGFKAATGKAAAEAPKAQQVAHAGAATTASTGKSKAKDTAGGRAPCVNNLLFTYNLKAADCSKGPNSCSLVHHADIKGWNYHAAKKLVKAVNLEKTVEQQLLEAMAKDTAKFLNHGPKSKPGGQGRHK